MPRSNDLSPPTSDNSAELRHQANRARRLARDLTTQRDKDTLLNFAEELERRAAELEAAGEPSSRAAARR